MADRDLYKILGVPRTATEAEIRKAYRNLARKNHPDRNPGDKAAEDRFKDASFASDVLMNAKKRELYDEFGEAGLREGFNADTHRAYRAAQARGGGAGGGRGPNLEDLFGGRRGGGPWGGGGFDGFYDAGRPGGVEELFGRGARRRAQQQPPPELSSEMTLSFLDALRGGERELQLAIPGESAPRTMRVRIPEGVKDGGQIRLRGQGIDGGDVVLKIHVDSHPFLARDDNDLVLTLPVTVGEAYRGAKIAVPTLDGEVTLTVPARSKSGGKLRLRGKGVKTKAATGDLIVVLQIRLPDAESPEIDAAVTALEAAYGESPRASIKL